MLIEMKYQTSISLWTLVHQFYTKNPDTPDYDVIILIKID